MAVTLASFQEVCADTSPCKAKFSRTASGASWQYLLQPQVATDLQDAVSLLLGSTRTDAGDGRIQRQLPAAHPIFPFLYASEVEVYGHGQWTLTASNEELEAPPLPQYALMDEYIFSVNFTPRPYPVLPDTSILTPRGKWTNPTGAPVSYKYATEWYRNCYYTVNGKEEAITAQQGNQVFRTGPPTTPPSGPPAGTSFSGMPKIFMPNQQIKVVWEDVPARYLTSEYSIISTYVGMINQNEWWDWEEGQLLYLGYEPTFYTPPIQQLVGGDQNAGGVFSTERMMNIAFNFLVTYRTANNPPTITNANWIAAHHNLFPWFGPDQPVMSNSRNWYYVTAPDPVVGGEASPNTTLQVPPFFSFPLELLFTDPDA